MKTLILGGYGNFGARICRALAPSPAIQLLIGGRDPARAQALAHQLGPGVEGIAIDHSAPDFPDRLRQLRVGLLIHTAGPFQQQSWDTAVAAAQAGAHYIDLADGRRFVCDFPSALDRHFRDAGRTAISGASTVPALSSAVIDTLARRWRSIDSIDICIAPAQTAPRGKATLAGVLSYCGEPIEVWDDGRWQPRRGWAGPQRVQFARMRPRLGALCDIPDLELFPARYAVKRRVMFRAALEVGMTQRAFAALAALRTIGLLKRPAALASTLYAAAPMFDALGSALGGMVIRVEGVDDTARRVRREWHIVADHDHGPEIPCMAAILLARRLAGGTTDQPAIPIGAHACAGLLDLAEFRPEFERWGMQTDLLTEALPDGPSSI